MSLRPPVLSPSRAPERVGPLTHVVRWFDSWAGPEEEYEPGQIDWLRVVPYLALHVACAAVLLVGWSPIAVAVAVALYLVRMFAITAFYHRYCSHRAFRMGRATQFAFALVGASCVQRGPLWWAAHHRLHHKHSDGAEDTHSPRQHGFLWSHTGWILDRANFRTRVEQVPDLARYPELRFLDRFDMLVPILLAVGLFGLGAVLEAAAPGLGTDRWQLFVWGFCISTVALYHCTFTINSLAHVFGRRRFETDDDSRNNWLLSLLTLGEGWHNNHHYYQASARQGFYWWEVDLSYYALVAMSWLGLVDGLRPVPERVLERGRALDAEDAER